MRSKSLVPWLFSLGLLIGLAALYSMHHKDQAELAQLRGESQELQKLRASAEESKKSQTQTDSEEVVRLRKDNEDLLRLRNEVSQLRKQTQQLAKQGQAVPFNSVNPQQQAQQQQLQQLAAENQQLRAQTQQIQQANQTAACINNLRQIDGAKQQWALENGKIAGALVGPQDLAPYLGNKTMPVCPAGGAYTLNPVGLQPLCNIPGHVLPK